MPDDSSAGIRGAPAMGRLVAVMERLRVLSAHHEALGSAVEEANALLHEVQSQQDNLLTLNRQLASVSAESAELVAERDHKNQELKRTNYELSLANARAAELIGEIEDKNQRIDTLNKTLSTANATAAELVAELETQRSELEKANKALRETNEEKAHILGVVAHDLRSGIGGMSGLADLLAEELHGATADAAEFVQLLQEESRRLLNLLSTLLDMSRLEQGRLHLHLEIRDLREPVAASLAYHQHFAEIKQQKLLENRSSIPLLCAFDPVRLRQVLDNLLSNAIKYSPPNSEIQVREFMEGGQIMVEILDQGPGLTEADSAKLFRSFQQLSAKPTGGEESHGLGLAIAKKVIESHHGQIWAKNRKDAQGAVFGFSLAAQRNPERAGLTVTN